jgi:hypothetical protein
MPRMKCKNSKVKVALVFFFFVMENERIGLGLLCTAEENNGNLFPKISQFPKSFGQSFLFIILLFGNLIEKMSIPLMRKRKTKKP